MHTTMNMSLKTKPAIEPETLIKEHLTLVKKVALHLSYKLPKSIQLDDLIQVGMIGLIEAARRFDPSKEASFPTYARIRIRGTILDELRRNSWLPRSTQSQMREISRAIHTIENQTGREAPPQKIAAFLHVSLDEYHFMISSAQANDLLSFEDFNPDTFNIVQDGASPEGSVERCDLLSAIKNILQSFPEKERLVLSLYYLEDLNFKEVGEIMELGEARVCQLHSQAIARLRSRMSNTI